MRDRRSDKFVAGNAPYTGQAQLAGDRWNMTAARPDALTCDDNSRAQGTTIYRGAGTFAGTAFSQGEPAVCVAEPTPTVSAAYVRVHIDESRLSELPGGATVIPGLTA